MCVKRSTERAWAGVGAYVPASTVADTSTIASSETFGVSATQAMVDAVITEEEEKEEEEEDRLLLDVDISKNESEVEHSEHFDNDTIMTTEGPRLIRHILREYF